MAALNSALFIAFAACLLGGAVAVLLLRDMVRAALFLVLAALSCAALCALLGHQYLALFLVLGYACTTLAMLGLSALCFTGNGGDDTHAPAYWRPAAAVVGLIVAAEVMLLVVFGDQPAVQPASSRSIAKLSAGQLVQYWPQALLAGLVVLTGLVGAAVIAFRQDVAEMDFNAYEPNEGLVLRDVARSGADAQ